MYRKVRIVSAETGCFGTSAHAIPLTSKAPVRARYASMSKTAMTPDTTSGAGPPDHAPGSARLVKLLVEALDLLVEGLAAAVGHRRLVGQPRVELDEQRALIGQHRGQAPLEILEIADGVRLAVARTLGHLHEVDGQPARNLLGTGRVVHAVLEEEMREIARPGAGDRRQGAELHQERAVAVEDDHPALGYRQGQAQAQRRGAAHE